MGDGGELEVAVGGPKFVWVAVQFATAIQDFLSVHASIVATKTGAEAGGIHAVPTVNTCISGLPEKREPPPPPLLLQLLQQLLYP